MSTALLAHLLGRYALFPETVRATALRHPALQSPSADAAECWFYALVHGAPEGRGPSLTALRPLLETGIRSPGFRLEPHVAIAAREGHPWAGWLEVLAQLLTDQAPLLVLDPWAEWRAALPGVIH